MRSLTLLIAGLAFTLSGGGAAWALEFPRPQSLTLENGLEILVIEDHRAPVVTHMLWYRAGSADEPPGRSGIAHFLEHLMFKGTEKFPDGAFSKIVARNGGRENAFTSYDYTAYFQRVAKDRLALVMELEADRMTGLRLAPEDVAPERDVVLEERRMRNDNDPASLFAEQMAAAQYLAHPYGRPIIGWLHEVETLGREDALSFYRRFYAPNNAVLVIAGDVTMAEVAPLARELYGAVAADHELGGPRARPQEPPQRAARRLSMADARVEQARWTRSYLAPCYACAEEAVALDALAYILGGGTTSRLYRRLVVEEKLSAAAGVAYSAAALDATQFVIYAVPLPGVTAARQEEAVDRVLGDLLEAGVDEEELALAKAELVAAAVYAQDSQFALARLYGEARVTGRTVEEVATWPDAIEALTAEDVTRAARDLLVPAHSVTGFLAPDHSEDAADDDG